MDGIVVTSSRVGALYLPLLAEMMVPIVLVNNQGMYEHTQEHVHSVMIGNEEGSKSAARHLIDLGHRRIAYIGDQYGYQSDEERLAGYREALREAGIELMPELVVRGDGKPEEATRAMEVLLSLIDPPSAVCCYNDMSALGAMRAARSRGLRIPQDISIVGFDDLFIAAYTDPPLTTVRQPMRKMGSLAMESLFRLMSGKEAEIQIKVDAELVVRGSTGRAREWSRREQESRS